MLAADRISPYRAYTPREITLPDGATRPVPECMSLAEFDRFPWPQGQRWELIWGKAVMTPAPQPPHQDLLLELALAIKKAVSNRSLKLFLGVDILLPDRQNFLCPDISVVKPDGDMTKGPLKVVPSLVVEALSPGTSANDLGSKREAYASAGVPEYWVADPVTGSILIHAQPTNGEYVQSPLDEDGFAHSALLGLRLRIRSVPAGFRIEVQPAP